MSTFLSALGVDGNATPNLAPGFEREQIIWGAPNVSRDPTGRGRYFNRRPFPRPVTANWETWGAISCRDPVWPLTVKRIDL